MDAGRQGTKRRRSRAARELRRTGPLPEPGRSMRPLQVFALLAAVAAAAPWGVAVTVGDLPDWLYAVGVVGFVLALGLLPMLVLPTAAPGSVVVRDGRLAARTTRGRRELSLLRLATVWGTEVPGRVGSSTFLWLRDVDGRGVLLVGRSLADPIPPAVTGAVRALDRRSPRRVSRGARQVLGLDDPPGLLLGTLGDVARALAMAGVLAAAVAVYLVGLAAVSG